MTDAAPPTAEQFAATVKHTMTSEGRKWAWLAGELGMPVNTLRSQIEKPSRISLHTARRISTTLNIPFWSEVA